MGGGTRVDRGDTQAEPNFLGMFVNTSPVAARCTTPPLAGECAADIGPLRFIDTVVWPLEGRHSSPKELDSGSGAHVRLRQPAALKQPPSAALLPEGVPPRPMNTSEVARRAAAGPEQSLDKELETLCSEPTTPPEPPALSHARDVVDGHGGDPQWQGASACDGTLPARSQSEWAAAGYVLLPAEDLLDKRVQEMVTDWGALGYLQLPDGEDTVAPHPHAGMTVQDGPASFGRWVMLNDRASPLKAGEASDALAGGGYIRLGSPGAPSHPEPVEDELDDAGLALDAGDAATSPRLDSPSGEGCLPPAELDELVQEYAALPALKATASTDAPAADATQATTAAVTNAEKHGATAPMRLGDTAVGVLGLSFDFVTSAERCELYLAESHDQLEAISRSVTKKRGGGVPADWRVEVDLQRKSSNTLAASRPLLARGGASSDNLAHVVEEAQRYSGVGGAKILSEAELPNLAAWGL